MSTRLNSEQRRMVEENHNLIYQYLIDNKLPQNDYYDIAALALCNAAINYDSSKNIAFSTYVYKTIGNTIKNYKTHDKRHTVDAISYNITSTVYGEGTDVEHLETFESRDNVEEENVTKAFFQWFIEYMSLRELQIMYYKTKNMTDKEIGKIYGVTHAAISRVWRRIKKAYRENDRVYTTKYVDVIKNKQEIKELKAKLLDIVELVV